MTETGPLVPEFLTQKMLLSTQQLVAALAQTPGSTTAEALYSEFGRLQKQLLYSIEQLWETDPDSAKTLREHAYRCLVMLWIAVMREPTALMAAAPPEAKAVVATHRDQVKRTTDKPSEASRGCDVALLMTAAVMTLPLVLHIEAKFPPSHEKGPRS